MSASSASVACASPLQRARRKDEAAAVGQIDHDPAGPAFIVRTLGLRLGRGTATAPRQGAVDFAIKLSFRSITRHLDLPHRSVP